VQERGRFEIVASVFARPKAWIAPSASAEGDAEIPDKRSTARHPAQPNPVDRPGGQPSDAPESLLISERRLSLFEPAP
jgi:hypothetical protein